MALRYQTEINNFAGDYFRIDILDADFTGSVSDFRCTDFDIEVQNSNSQRWFSIWGSECVLDCASTASMNLDTLIDDIRDAAEERFQIVIYKKDSSGGTYSLEWLGMVLNDLSGGMDEAPVQNYTIVATDGLGALKGLDYKTDNTTPVGEITLGAVVLHCLKQLPTSSFWSNGDAFLQECVKYYEGEMPSTNGSVLSWTKVPGTAFFEIDKDGVYKWMSCYEVLSSVCLLMKSRIYFSDGIWKFYNIREWETQSSLTVWVWTYAGTVATSSASVSIRQTIDGSISGARLSAQSFEYFPALRKISQVYAHETSRNLIQGITVDTAAGLQTVQTLTISNTSTLVFAGTLHVIASEVSPSGSSSQVFIKLRMAIKLGAYYLKRNVTNQIQNNDYANLTWENSINYIEYIAVFNVNFLGGIYLAVSFETPSLPTSAALQMNLEKVYIQDLQQNNKASVYNYSATFAALYVEYVDGDAENERTYEVFNNVAAVFTAQEELSEAFYGDKINSMTQNHLKVWDGSAFVDSDSNWARGNTGGNKPLLQLGLEDMMAGQRTSILKRQGDFVGRFKLGSVLAIAGVYFLPLRVRFSALNAQYSGEWYEIGTYNDSNIGVGYILPPAQGRVIPPSLTLPTVDGSPSLPERVVANNGQLQISALANVDALIVNDSNDAEMLKINSAGKFSLNNQMVIGGNSFSSVCNCFLCEQSTVNGVEMRIPKW